MQAINQNQLIHKLNTVRAELEARGRTDRFYDDLAASFLRYGSLTERQEAALERSLARYDESKARRNQPRAITRPIPTGRVTITGAIVSTKWQSSAYGDTFKMLVESDLGWRVFGTVPSRLLNHGDLRPGMKVAFTAEVTPKEAVQRKPGIPGFASILFFLATPSAVTVRACRDARNKP